MSIIRVRVVVVAATERWLETPGWGEKPDQFAQRHMQWRRLGNATG
jgi:hypothetical protein